MKTDGGLMETEGGLMNSRIAVSHSSRWKAWPLPLPPPALPGSAKNIFLEKMEALCVLWICDE